MNWVELRLHPQGGIAGHHCLGVRAVFDTQIRPTGAFYFAETRLVHNYCVVLQKGPKLYLYEQRKYTTSFTKGF